MSIHTRYAHAYTEPSRLMSPPPREDALELMNASSCASPHYRLIHACLSPELASLANPSRNHTGDAQARKKARLKEFSTPAPHSMPPQAPREQKPTPRTSLWARNAANSISPAESRSSSINHDPPAEDLPPQTPSTPKGRKTVGFADLPIHVGVAAGPPSPPLPPAPERLNQNDKNSIDDTNFTPIQPITRITGAPPFNQPPRPPNHAPPPRLGMLPHSPQQQANSQNHQNEAPPPPPGRSPSDPKAPRTPGGQSPPFLLPQGQQARGPMGPPQPGPPRHYPLPGAHSSQGGPGGRQMQMPGVGGKGSMGVMGGQQHAPAERPPARKQMMIVATRGILYSAQAIMIALASKGVAFDVVDVPTVDRDDCPQWFKQVIPPHPNVGWHLPSESTRGSQHTHYQGLPSGQPRLIPCNPPAAAAALALHCPPLLLTPAPSL